MTQPYVAGIDLGGTHMQVGVVDAAGAIVARAGGKTLAEGGRDSVINRMIDCLADVCRDAGVDIRDLAAAGVAAPGAMDIARGVVLEAPNLGWRDAPLRDMLHERLNIPIVVDNDVNAAVWGEYRAGAGRGADDLLGVWVGTGVGGGLVIGRSIYHGPFFTAGEIGHTIIDPRGEPGRRTLEDFASRTGISRTIMLRLPSEPHSLFNRLADHARGVVSSAALAEAWQAGDALATEVIEQAAQLLGIAAANCATLLSLNRIIIGGGISEALGEVFLQLIRRSFERDVFPARLRECQLVLTELRADAGLIGAAMLARQRFEQ